ncbi:hypothetical protein AQS8620_00475 [Aquimixticola soesokkakensis]|uniref:Uncharacterized protein n=1 Tax=Aquimixticola soesokkakensis TaxID=1519096 RepID=A0A1Y5RKW3_9RHOB|nr:hypothetical protein [Aquimixticola soesokkakensis]SLN19572.1 hypothetical protein AQS8620_00475 [Aquimixticola soesokkakensis]
MLYDLLATIVFGVGAGGIAIALRKTIAKGLPGWIVPACAGLAMLAFTIFNEYAWYPNTVAHLPEGTIKAQAVPEARLYRPWTFAAPTVMRFIALSDIAPWPDAQNADQRSANIVLVERWKEAFAVPVVFDCTSATRYDFPAGLPAQPVDLAQQADGVSLENDDPLLTTACKHG